jgi:hypothetical protein
MVHLSTWPRSDVRNCPLCLSLFRVTARCDKYGRVIGHVFHEFPVANGVRPEAGRAGSIRRARGVVDIKGVKGKGMGPR